MDGSSAILVCMDISKVVEVAICATGYFGVGLFR